MSPGKHAPSFLQQIKKLLVYLAGGAAILLSSGQLDGRTEAIVSGLVFLATGAGIYQVKNAQPQTQTGYVGEHRGEA